MKNTGEQRTNERDEAERIYRAIFRAPIPSDVRDRYYGATKILFSGFSPEEDQAFAELLSLLSLLSLMHLLSFTEFAQLAQFAQCLLSLVHLLNFAHFGEFAQFAEFGVFC